jgi:hypothetical protein
LGGNHDFLWNWLADRGHSGGILLGVKQDCVRVGAFDEGEQFLSALLRNKKDGFKWEVIVVYGPAHHDKSRDFFGEVGREV